MKQGVLHCLPRGEQSISLRGDKKARSLRRGIFACRSELVKRFDSRIVIPVKTGIQYNKKMDRNHYVYILASKEGGTLYIGVTNNLKRRVFEHKEKKIEGFTKEHNVNRLVYFEQTTDVQSAIAREKCLKKWNRRWKIELIEQQNKRWKDLYEEI